MKRSESEYDAFGAGHSSTSISAALGMAVGRDAKGKRNNVIAVIGDGAITGGMAYEAMNHAGFLDKNMIVILNDNQQARAPILKRKPRFAFNNSATLRTDLERSTPLRWSRRASAALPTAQARGCRCRCQRSTTTATRTP